MRSDEPQQLSTQRQLTSRCEIGNENLTAKMKSINHEKKSEIKASDRLNNDDHENQKDNSDSSSEGEDDSDDSDDGDDVSAKRRKILEDINAGKITKETYEQRENLERINDCLQSNDEHDPTFIHAMVGYIKTNGIQDLSVYKLVAALALEDNKDLMKAGADSTIGTALHAAIDRGLGSFAYHLCKTLKKEDAAKIINLKRRDGKDGKDGINCLQLAIDKELDNLKKIVKYADIDTFKLRCNSGNTILHEVVDYKRCKGKQKDIVEAVFNKWPEAISEINKAGKSPYQYHHQTRASANLPQNKLSGVEIKYNPLKPVVGKANMNGPNLRGDGFAPNTENEKNTNDKTVKRHPRNGVETPTAEMSSPNQEISKSRKDTFGKSDNRPSQKPRTKSKSLSENVAAAVEKFLEQKSLSVEKYRDMVTSIFGSMKSESKVYFSLLDNRQSLSCETTEHYNFLNFHHWLSLVGLKVSPSQKTVEVSPADANPSIGDSPTTRITQIAQDVHSPIPAIFEWLKEEKKVRKVLKVLVRDDENRPCRDDAIENALKNLDVRYLNWNKIDLCSETIHVAAPNVNDLWLYSSGNNAVLRGWAQLDGLGKLSNLRKVYLHMKAGLESDDRNDENVKRFKKVLNTVFQNEYGRILEFDPPKIERHPHEGFYRHRRTSARIGFEDKPHDWLGAVEDFGPIVRNAYMDSNVKVALIDDGIDVGDNELSHNIVDGKSFDDTDPNTPNAYYYSSNGHGTIMAQLIRRMCPVVKIYVAKLDVKGQTLSSTGRFTAKCAAKAVRWAIEKNVDVISMSWTIDESDRNKQDITELRRAIEAATSKGILAYCATRDLGYTPRDIDKVYPKAGDPKGIKVVGAATPSGTKWDCVQDEVDYLFPGVNVIEPKASSSSNPQQQQQQNNKEHDGSSVATALAAGLSALVMVCCSSSNKRGEIFADREQRPRKMDKLFQGLTPKNDSSKYVMVGKLLDPAMDSYRNSNEAGMNKDSDAVAAFVQQCQMYMDIR